MPPHSVEGKCTNWRYNNIDSAFFAEYLIFVIVVLCVRLYVCMHCLSTMQCPHRKRPCLCALCCVNMCFYMYFCVFACVFYVYLCICTCDV